MKSIGGQTKDRTRCSKYHPTGNQINEDPMARGIAE